MKTLKTYVEEVVAQFNSAGLVLLRYENACRAYVHAEYPDLVDPLDASKDITDPCWRARQHRLGALAEKCIKYIGEAVQYETPSRMANEADIVIDIKLRDYCLWAEVDKFRSQLGHKPKLEQIDTMVKV